MYSREDVVKLLLNKKGADAFATGGVSSLNNFKKFYASQTYTCYRIQGK
jgi:hypothetical protein